VPILPLTELPKDQVTLVLLVPVTLAVNCCSSPVSIVGLTGVTVTVTLACCSVTIAVPEALGSARLVAVMVI